MNIVVVVDDFHGGAGNIAQLLATELSASHDVWLVLTNLHSPKRYPLENIHIADCNLSITGKNKITGLISSIRRIDKLLRHEIGADIVISFLDNNNSLVCLSQWFNKTPIIVSERSNPLAIYPKAPWDKIRRIAYRRANVVTVQFSHFAQFDNARFQKKCRVTSNIVQAPPCLKKEWTSERTRFVTFGRLQDIKRMDLMIDLFDLAQQKDPSIELHIYGDGHQKEALQRKIDSLGLSDKVFLKGYCNQVHQTLIEYDVYLMTSLQEGFPNSLCEAMAVGLPSVAFACHEGIVELCEHEKSGFAIPEGETDAFVEKMLFLAHDPMIREKMGISAQKISCQYSKERIMNQWQECINEVVK